MNKVILIGRLVKENELRYTANGKAVLNNTMAVRRDYKNAEGTYDSDFINILVYGQRAEFMNKYTKKGLKVAIEGRIQTSTYNDKEGNKRYVTEVVVDSVEFIQPLDSKTNTPKEETEEATDPFADFGEQIQITDKDLPF